MAIWDLLKQAPLAAIGRAVQSWLQPQQTQNTSGGAPASSGGQSVWMSPTGQPVASYNPTPNLQNPSSNTPGNVWNNPSAGGGFGGSSGGGDTDLQKLAKMNRNPIQEQEYQRLLQQSGGSSSGGSSQGQMSMATAPTPAFDMGAFARKLQEQMSSVGQKITSGVGATGNAIKQGGSNLLSAIGRSVQPLPATKVGAYDVNAPVETKKSPGWYGLNTAVKGTWNPFGINLPDVGITEKLFGGKGSTEATALYNPAAAQVGQIGAKGYGTMAPQVPATTLPETPPTLGGDGGGGGGSQFGNIPSWAVPLFEEAFLTPQVPLTPQEQVDLAAYADAKAQEYGIPQQQAIVKDLNEQALKITDSLESIDAEVTAEGGGALMTEGQRQRLVEARSRPLREQLIKIMRSAQYAGVGLSDLISMLNQHMAAKQQTTTNQFQAAQLAQNEEEARRKRQMDLLAYAIPKAQTLSSGGGGGEMSLEQLLG